MKRIQSSGIPSAAVGTDHCCSSPFWGPIIRWTCSILTLAGLGTSFVASSSTNYSIARDWDEQILSAIRIDKPHPPVHARNLFSLSVAMYDAWAAYTNGPVGYVFRGKATANDIEAARREAISYAAYRILRERYALSIGANNTLPALDAHLASLGYDPNNGTRDLKTPAGVGNSVYDAVSAWFIDDGSLQTNGYRDVSVSKGGYSPVNGYLNVGLSGIDPTTLIDVNRWQPLEIPNAVDQNGIPTGPKQTFLGSQWLGVRPFSLSRLDASKAWIDPGPEPKWGTSTSASFVSNVVEVIRRSSQLTPDDGVTIDISPGAFGNNPLGSNAGSGHPINPATGLPYPSNVVPRGDFARVLAEYFADGPKSETPPGHWNVLANAASANTNLVKRIGGVGPVVNDLEWDVKLYFALNVAVHEAACAAWSLKRQYDGWRPLTAIRFLGSLGQSTDPTLPAYHTNGLPLIPGLIELVTAATSAPGGRHAGLPVNSVALLSWAGQPADPAAQYGGVVWGQPADWLPYQKTNFVTPAFPGYVSGHSTFSRAAAEVLTAITGSPFFPGGLGIFTAVAGKELTTEYGPSQTVQLQWATYYDAADQAGVSRLWGGIHPPIDDFTGRIVGAQCGSNVWALASRFFDGSVGKSGGSLVIQPLGGLTNRLAVNAVRGLFYRLQFTPDLAQPFVDQGDGATLALTSPLVVTNGISGNTGFYRVQTALQP